MTHVTCRLTAKNRDQLRNPTLGNRVWAIFTFFNADIRRRRPGRLGTSRTGRRQTRSVVTAGRVTTSAHAVWVVRATPTARTVAITRSTRPICSQWAARNCLPTTTSLTTARYLHSTRYDAYTRVVRGLGWPMGWVELGRVGSKFFSFWWVGLG